MRGARPTELYLVRHGETVMNAEGRFCGRSDPELTERGRFQAEAVAAWIKPLGVAAVYASPLRRALETATLIARALGREVRVRRGLAERDYGEWDGLTYREIYERWPEETRRFKDDPAAHAPPGGETALGVLRRFRRALAAVARVHAGEPVAVVAHQSALRIYLASLLSVPLSDHYKNDALVMPNSAVSLVRLSRDGAEVVWIGRTGHLGPC